MYDKRQSILLTGFCIAIAIIVIWVVEIAEGKIPYVDQWTRGFVPEFQDTLLFAFFRDVTNFGSSHFLLPFTIISTILLLILFKDWLAPLILGGGTLSVHLLNHFIKVLVKRERPAIWMEANAEGFSFPSGHSMITMVFYGLLGYYLSKLIKSERVKFFVQSLFAILILLIGLSRYVINVHYLTDILAGFTIGFACLMILIFIDKWVRKKRTQ